MTPLTAATLAAHHAGREAARAQVLTALVAPEPARLVGYGYDLTRCGHGVWRLGWVLLGQGALISWPAQTLGVN